MSTTQAEVDRLIEQFDPEASFRRLTGWSAKIVLVLCAGLAAWHYYTAGFGLHNEIAHRAIHLTVVLGLCFLVFPRQKRLPGPWEWLVSLGLVGTAVFATLERLGMISFHMNLQQGSVADNPLWIPVMFVLGVLGLFVTLHVARGVGLVHGALAKNLLVKTAQH